MTTLHLCSLTKLKTKLLPTPHMDREPIGHRSWQIWYSQNQAYHILTIPCQIRYFLCLKWNREDRYHNIIYHNHSAWTIYENSSALSRIWVQMLLRQDQILSQMESLSLPFHYPPRLLVQEDQILPLVPLPWKDNLGKNSWPVKITPPAFYSFSTC